MVLRISKDDSRDNECGHAVQEQFQFHPSYLNLNHGSFGASPKAIRDIQKKEQDEAEARPDVYIRYTYPQKLDASRKAIADHLNAPVDACVFVPNATTGINTVLRNLVYKPNDVVIYFATVYGSCEKTLAYLTETTPVSTHKILYTLPISDNALLKLFTDTISQLRVQGQTPRLALFDTISSLPGIRMPYESLTRLCRTHNVLSLIDGAHGLGHLDLDLSALDPDFFVSNAHKWLYVPRSCAVLYVPFRNQDAMRSSLPTSHGFVPKGKGPGIVNPLPASEKSEFVYQFEFVGTLDGSAYLCVGPALAWIDSVTWGEMRGLEAVRRYCRAQAREVGALMARRFGTEVLENAERTLGDCNFSNVRLPLDYGDLVGGDFKKAVEVALWIQEISVKEFDTFLAVYVTNEAWWVRISAQIYLTSDDWERGTVILEQLCARAKKREWEEAAARSET